MANGSCEKKDYFNPRLPCGRRRNGLCPSWLLSAISIHAFRVEGDRVTVAPQSQQSANFNPRLPCGRRLMTVLANKPSTSISIHAFRVEGDSAHSEGMIELTVISIHAFRVEGDNP